MGKKNGTTDNPTGWHFPRGMRGLCVCVCLESVDCQSISILFSLNQCVFRLVAVRRLGDVWSVFGPCGVSSEPCCQRARARCARDCFESC
jgi:hypothetical protein